VPVEEVHDEDGIDLNLEGIEFLRNTVELLVLLVHPEPHDHGDWVSNEGLSDPVIKVGWKASMSLLVFYNSASIVVKNTKAVEYHLSSKEREYLGDL